jgi:glycosyltransferase involved in cell wall biosynthesis
MRKRITIVSMNLSTNCTNRCFRIAQALAPHYDAEIVGTTFGMGKRWGEGIWPPLDGQTEVPIHSVSGDYFPGYLISVIRLLKMIDGDIVIACKPRFPSLGIALICKLVFRKQLILDIDDDELAQTLPGKRASFLRKLINPTGYLWTRLIHGLHRFADAKFVVSRNFQTRYGGVIVPHPMDKEEFDPSHYDRAAIRQGLGIQPEQFVIGFVGSPSVQKGTDLIPMALERIPDSRLRVLIVGAVLDDPYILEIKRACGDRLLLIPMQPLARLPEFLAASDLIALPQRATPESWGQMPAKLTDAMAMAKPIVAAARADIPEYLAEGRGLTFEAEDLDGFVSCIEWLLAHPNECVEMGRKAREYFLSHLTMERVGAVMAETIQDLMK